MSYSVITVCVGNIVTFSVGTAITWSSPELDKLKNSTLAITDEEGSWISSLFHLGAAFGPFLFGYLADRLGRKLSLLITGVPITLSFLLMAFVKNLYVFYLARFLSGITTGGVFTVMPMYIGEIAESSNRGLLGGLMNNFLCIGMLFSYCVGPYMNILGFNLLLAIFPIIFISAFFFLAVETPRYLMSKNQPKKARDILRKVRGRANIDEEINAIEKAIEEEGRGEILDLFRSSGNFKALYMIVGLLSFQQFSGINAVLSYAQTIFSQAGSSLAPEVCSMIVGLVQLISSFSASALIDRLGRKVLLILSGIGMVISELPLGIYSYLKDEEGKDLSSLSTLPIICLILYILFFNIGTGSLPWTILGEVFPSNVKPFGSSLASSLCWFLAFLIVKYFQALKDATGLGVCFVIFAAFCAVSVAFTKFLVIETKGKTLEQIQDELNKIK